MRRLAIILLFSSVVVPADAAETEVQMLHAATGDTHCYRIIHNARKPLQEISLGSSWGGHPIKDSIDLRVLSKPSGWKAEKTVRTRHGYQFVLLTAPEVPGSASTFPTGNLGSVCIQLSGNLPDMDALPFAYQLQGEPNRIAAKTTSDDGRGLHALDNKGNEVIEKVGKAKDAVEVIDKLKDIF